MPIHQYITPVAAALSGGSSPPPPPPPYTTGGVELNGGGVGLGNDAFVVPDSPLGLMSFWVNPADNTDYVMWGDTQNGYFWIIAIPTGGDTLTVDLWDGPTNSVHFAFSVSGLGLVVGTWYNFLISVDTNHGAGLKVAQVVVNDAVQTVTVDSDNADAFDVGWGVPGETTYFGVPSHNLVSWGADWWFGFGQRLDLSVTGNRRKFIDGSGKPVDLGADGSTPTGTAPAIFLRRAPSAAASTFATNLGTGGNFTITGTLTNSPSSPSDP